MLGLQGLGVCKQGYERFAGGVSRGMKGLQGLGVCKQGYERFAGARSV